MTKLDLDKMPVGVVHLNAQLFTHFKLIPVSTKDGGPYLALMVGLGTNDTQPGALKFDSFPAAMDFCNAIMHGIEETFPEKYAAFEEASHELEAKIQGIRSKT